MKRTISFLYVKLTLSLMFIFMSTLTVLALEQPSSYTQGYEDHFLKGDGSVDNYIISDTTQQYYKYNEDVKAIAL